MKTQSEPAPFRGFDRDAMAFWHELAAEMNREWFLANKARYEATWVVPMSSLLHAVSSKLARAYPGKKIGAPKVMRIHRDVRFSKDKAPYKTYIGGMLPIAAGRITESVAALYVHFGIDDGGEEEIVAIGQYAFPPELIPRWRKRVADAKTGPVIAKLLAGLDAKGYGRMAIDTLARVPKPYDAEHPRGDLLRMKGLVVSPPAIPKGLIHKPAFVDWLADHAARAAPVVHWLLATA